MAPLLINMSGLNNNTASFYSDFRISADSLSNCIKICCRIVNIFDRLGNFLRFRHTAYGDHVMKYSVVDSRHNLF